MMNLLSSINTQLRTDSASIMTVRALTKNYAVSDRAAGIRSQSLVAVDGVDLEIREGEVLGLVGESGCGKSTLGKCLLRLIEPTSGKVFFRDEEVTSMRPRDLRAMRRRLAVIFQDPYSSLDPRQTIGDIVGEPLVVHKMVSSRQKRRQRVAELLELVGLDARLGSRYPHEFSGGQRQRVGIARALAVEPEFVFCDEPVSSLDVSIQAQIVTLLKGLQKELKLSLLFVSHDLSVVSHIADRIAVMYLGKIVEVAPSRDLQRHPRHPYTRALLSAVPSPDPGVSRTGRIRLRGEIPSAANPPSGCRFRTRCYRAQSSCAESQPLLEEDADGRSVACFYPCDNSNLPDHP